MQLLKTEVQRNWSDQKSTGSGEWRSNFNSCTAIVVQEWRRDRHWISGMFGSTYNRGFEHPKNQSAEYRCGNIQLWSIKNGYFCRRIMPKNTATGKLWRRSRCDCHPLYNPDLASSDYLSPLMAHFLQGYPFNNLDEVDSGCRKFFTLKNKQWCRCEMEELTDKWLQPIEQNDRYCET